MSHVAVCGPGIATQEEAAWAQEVGRLLAEAGAVVVCGGSAGSWTRPRGEPPRPGASPCILPGGDRTGASPHLTTSVPTA